MIVERDAAGYVDSNTSVILLIDGVKLLKKFEFEEGFVPEVSGCVRYFRERCF